MMTFASPEKHAPPPTGLISLPTEAATRSEEDCIQLIRRVQEEQGPALLILGHHYQRKEITALSDFLGDSFELSKRASEQEEARSIVFCGVHFMAESADILRRPAQAVYLPEHTAGCPMADMASLPQVEEAWQSLCEHLGPNPATPITYMNSDAELKAFCGRHQGTVCTSSNAQRAFEWAFGQRKRILFFPDEHLGRNTANALQLPREEVLLYDPHLPQGGLSPSQIEQAQVFLWKGFCHVHTAFSTRHIQDIRQRYPQATILVHPECPEEVVAAADAVGSTAFIVNAVRQAQPGSHLVIGTEINLVHRLALEFPDRTIHELHRSLCPNMYRVNLQNLAFTLEHLGEVNRLVVPEDVRHDARLALQQMLQLHASS